MKANNLTVCISAGCNKNCPYCVSKMTWAPDSDNYLFQKNLHKAKMMAEIASVSSVLITSKGEPFCNTEMIDQCIETFRDFPVELQTNGTLLRINDLSTTQYVIKGLNVIAISIDNFDFFLSIRNVIECYAAAGIVVRITLVLTNLWNCPPDIFLEKCREFGVRQITFRHVTIPDKILNTEESNKIRLWILNNVSYQKNSEFMDYFRKWMIPENLIREMPFGASIYDCEGTSIASFDYCIQESNNTEDIRSLIYHQDGHVYTAWDKPSSILF